MTAYSLAMNIYTAMINELAQQSGLAGQVSSKFDTQSLDFMTLINQAQVLALAAEIKNVSAIPQLTSIFGHLYQAGHNRYYAPELISTSATQLIPREDMVTDLPSYYKKIWDAFQPQWEQQLHATENPAVCEANLHALLQRYTWTMAAPLTVNDENNQTNINFYDYARISAALAVCLHKADELATSTPALLVGGDVSGVQEWLYTFGSGGAAKSLRGRSFYLQLLSEVIGLYVLDRLQLPQANLLYAGGGGFYLLTPVSAANELDNIRREISQKLLKMHEGAIYVALGYAPLTTDQLLGKNGKRIGDAWHDVSTILERQKAQRFGELSEAEMAEVIGSPLTGTGVPEETCHVCRRAMSPGEKSEWTDDPAVNPNAGKKCALCQSFEELGRQLPKASFLVITQVKPATLEQVTTWQQGLEQFGYDVQVLPAISTNAQSGADQKSWRKRESEFVRIYYWEGEPDIQEFPGWPGDERTVWAFRPLAQCTPTLTDEYGVFIDTADFSDLAQASDGIKRWGVLRMDVDNLGQIFRSALPTQSLCGVVGVSGLLRLFFEGWVPKLAQRYNEGGKPRVYLMYAGGDDLFIVGSWSILPTLAHDIRTDFGRFACSNEQVTISGGISLGLDEKYPLYQAARDAGHAEELAKDLPGKDGIAFLGQALKWGNEYDRVATRMRQLTNWIEGGNLDRDDQAYPQKASNLDNNYSTIRTKRPLPRSFLMSLRAIDIEWRTWKKQERKDKHKNGLKQRYIHADKELYLGPWLWHMIYLLHQAAERTRDGDIIRDVKELAMDIVTGEIKTLGLTARWAELITRTEVD